MCPRSQLVNSSLCSAHFNERAAETHVDASCSVELNPSGHGRIHVGDSPTDLDNVHEVSDVGNEVGGCVDGQSLVEHVSEAATARPHLTIG